MKRISFIIGHIGLAGAVTLASLGFAWAAIALLLNQQIKFAVLCSVTAFLLDTADGFLARKLGTTSEFGKQLDGMVDAINYSVLAALVTATILVPNIWGWLIGFLILACGLIRLVLFNINGFSVTGETYYYRGIVTPHLTLATAILGFGKFAFNLPEWAIAVVLVLLAIGQLSTIKVKKTGAIIFWLPSSLLIAIGALLWL